MRSKSFLSNCFNTPRLMMSPTGNVRQTQHDTHHESFSPPSHSAGTFSRSSSIDQARSQPIQSRSFRILQMIHDPANDPSEPEADQVDHSGRRSSAGSNHSGASASRISSAGPPPPVGERRLNLTQDDRELMDMFRSQGNNYIHLIAFLRAL